MRAQLRHVVMVAVIGAAALGLPTPASAAATAADPGDVAGADVRTGTAERRFAGPPVDVVVVDGGVWLRALPMVGRVDLVTAAGRSAGTFTGLEWQLVSLTNPASIDFYGERDYHFDDLGDCQGVVIGRAEAVEDATAQFVETLRCPTATFELSVDDVAPIRVRGFLAGWDQSVHIERVELPTPQDNERPGDQSHSADGGR